MVASMANANGLPLKPIHRAASPSGGLPNAYVRSGAVPSAGHPNSDNPKSKHNLVQAVADVSPLEREHHYLSSQGRNSQPGQYDCRISVFLHALVLAGNVPNSKSLQLVQNA